MRPGNRSPCLDGVHEHGRLLRIEGAYDPAVHQQLNPDDARRISGYGFNPDLIARPELAVGQGIENDDIRPACPVQSKGSEHNRGDE